MTRHLGRVMVAYLLTGCARPQPLHPQDLDPTLVLDDVDCTRGDDAPPDGVLGPDACHATTLRCDPTTAPPTVTLEVPSPHYTFTCPGSRLGTRAERAWRERTWLEIRRQQGHASLCLGFEELARRAVSNATTCDEAQRRLDEELARNAARQAAFARAWDRAHPPSELPAATAPDGGLRGATLPP